MDLPIDTAGIVHLSQSFTDAGAFSRAMLGGQFEILPLAGESFQGSLRLLQLGDVMVQRARLGPHVSRNALAGDGRTLLLPIGRPPARAPSVNGAAIGPDDALILPGGAEFHCHCTDTLEWAALMVPPGLLEACAELAPLPARTAGVSVLGLSAESTRHLAEALAATATLVSMRPESVPGADGSKGLAASLREVLMATLTSGAELLLSRPRAAREAQRLVLAAEDFLVAHLDKPVYSEDLCAALGVSLRKLHDAFVATVALSPHAYLKARRLRLAREALQRADGSTTQVKSVALSHGFWHASRFAQEYRQAFGQTPSETLGAARAGRTPAQPRRILARSIADSGY